MKTTLSITRYLILLSIFILFSCSSDDDSSDSTALSAQNFVTTVDENQAGATSLGTIQASGQGALSFSITSQTPVGALAINASTGELTVADASAFDYETNTVISATVSVIDSQSTVTATVAINLNDMDNIMSSLSTSQADYTAATDGDWVIITEAEYDNLANMLNQITKVATSDAEYDNAIAVGTSTPNFTIANNNGHDVPNSSYVFAFKFNAQTDASANNKVLISTINDITGPYSVLGNTLPASTTEDQFYVLKGSNNLTTSSGFLGFYNSNTMGYKSTGECGFTSGESLTLGISNSCGLMLYQGLSTTQMQW